jgi:hypothetical protein
MQLDNRENYDHKRDARSRRLKYLSATLVLMRELATRVAKS